MLFFKACAKKSSVLLHGQNTKPVNVYVLTLLTICVKHPVLIYLCQLFPRNLNPEQGGVGQF